MSSTPENTCQGSQSLFKTIEQQVKDCFALYKDALPTQGLYKEIVNEVERCIIRQALAVMEGNQLRASELLGINRNTLRKKIKDLNIHIK